MFVSFLGIRFGSIDQ